MLTIRIKGNVLVQKLNITRNAQLPKDAVEKANEKDFKFRLRGVTD